MSRGDFGYAIRGILYNARGAQELPGMIARAAATGDVIVMHRDTDIVEVEHSNSFSEGDAPNEASR